MRIEIITPSSTKLEENIFKAVGKTLESWEIVKGTNGLNYLTPLATQYKNVVILQFIVKDDKLTVFPNFWNGKTKPADAVNAIVIGMFTAALLTHFSSDFTKLETYK